jgi:uncharacterized protein (TIGR03437 family)
VSAPVFVAMQQTAPGFFLFGSGPYAAATHADGSYLGPASLYPSLTTPAKPGEEITLYAGGFGQTTPAIVNGSQSQSGNLIPLPVISVGGRTAAIQFAGAVSPGLYQLNIVVPDSVPAGDNAISASSAGLTTQTGVVIPVEH